LIAITCRIDFAAHWVQPLGPKRTGEQQQLAMTIKDMPYKWVSGLARRAKANPQRVHLSFGLAFN